MHISALAFTIATMFAGLLITRPAAASDPVEIKLATLAPKGSAWAKIMESGAKSIDTSTSGRVKFKFFFGGQQGDERDVVRKMKLGQLDGGGITAVGLGIIKGDVRVMELPFLFRSDKELDYVRDKMADELEKQFDSAGYVLLAWADVGWASLYSNTPITSKAELVKTKMWVWTDDAIVRALFSRLGVNGVPLGVPDVLPALQTGLINACYGPPLAAVALQWYTKVKYGTATPIAYSIGAIVVKKDVFAKISAEDQALVRAGGRTIGEQLMNNIRKDNERAKKAMEKSGIAFVTIPPAALAELDSVGKKVWDDLAGKVYAKDFLEKVKRTLAEFRKE